MKKRTPASLLDRKFILWVGRNYVLIEICIHYLRRITQPLFNLVCIEAKFLNKITPILFYT